LGTESSFLDDKLDNKLVILLRLTNLLFSYYWSCSADDDSS